MNRILIIIFILMYSEMFSAKPLIELSDLPQNSELELYEDNEGIFALKIMEYYKISVVLETQLKLLGVNPTTKVLTPTLEELEDTDLKTLRKYYKVAKSLDSILKITPDSDRQILLEKINDLEQRIRDTVAIYTIEKGEVRNKMLDLMLTRLKDIEKQNAENIDLVIDQNYVNCIDYNNWLSIGGISKIFISNGADAIKNDPGLGAQVTFNIGKLSGFWEGFELRYEYFSPKIYSEYDYGSIPNPREQWKINMNSVSGGGKILIGKTAKFIQSFNVFAGYFWADGNIYNRNSSNVNWDGVNLNFDYSVAAPSCRFPFELFAGISLYHSFSRSLIFQTQNTGYENIDLGKTHLGLNIGLRYNIWRSPF